MSNTAALLKILWYIHSSIFHDMTIVTFSEIVLQGVCRVDSKTLWTIRTCARVHLRVLYQCGIACSEQLVRMHALQLQVSLSTAPAMAVEGTEMHFVMRLNVL